MFKQRRKQLSQNFLYSRKLVRQLVGHSSITQNDIVMDIGAGKGILTSILAQYAKHVVGIELDRKLVLHLRSYFDSQSNVSIIEGDILQLKLIDTLRKFSNTNTLAYKVFANIPFAIEGQIVRHLLDSSNPPQDSYLVVRRDLAERLSGFHQPGQFFVSHLPWFEFAIVHHFRRADFTPSPKVDSVLWHIHRREQPLLPWPERPNFEKFVRDGFKNGQRVSKNLSIAYGHHITPLMRQQGVPSSSKPSRLGAKKWIQLYKSLESASLN